MNVNKLKGKIVEKTLTFEKLAELINVDKSTLYRKINIANGETVSIREADAIARHLDLNSDEALAIFFSQYVA